MYTYQYFDDLEALVRFLNNNPVIFTAMGRTHTDQWYLVYQFINQNIQHEHYEIDPGFYIPANPAIPVHDWTTCSAPENPS